VDEEDGVRIAEEINEPGPDLLERQFSPDHFVGDAMHVSGFGEGHLHIDQLLERRQLPPMRAKAYVLTSTTREQSR
jgi:hypothetical protein